MTNTPKKAVTTTQRHKVANVDYGLIKPSIFVYDTKKVDRSLFPERTFQTEVNNRNIDVYIRPGNYLTHKHLSLLLAIMSMTAVQSLSAKDLDLETGSDRDWLACKATPNELIQCAGLRHGGNINSEIEDLIIGLRGVEYIDRGNKNANLESWATSGPVIVARREHSGPKADWYIALNRRLSEALIKGGGWSHRRIDLDRYRTFNALERMVYVRLAAKYYNKREINKIAVSTLFEEVYGHKFDTINGVKRTMYNKMKALKNSATNVINSDGFEGSFDEEERILYYKVPKITDVSE